ncbi:uncharacterized protein [Salvelinus alpinus]|uniref:uncharacterized protein n=1 Tax=Salvelinus alpinus TaxID=8036 RepID=UPI0039FBC5A0
MSLILLLFLSACVGDSMEQETITPVKSEVNVLQGTDITLSCNYKGNIFNLQWYRQYPGSRPVCLLLIQQSGMYVQNTSITTPRHTGRLNEEKTRVDLMISSVELEDSALYHCALQPTVTGNPDTLYKNLSINYDKVTECVDLKISSAEVTDSALYYCALRLTVKGNPDTLFKNWYQQYPGSSPIFLFLTGVSSNPSVVKAKPEDPRLSVKLNNERTCVDLEISSAEVADSALYYCALEPTMK